uniref:Uncharacterized protein n=1 Tax=Heterorhabditis bacteriophora TaxID=37862 RepID=A0A1I7XDX4_HETBA
MTMLRKFIITLHFTALCCSADIKVNLCVLRCKDNHMREAL